MRYAIAGACAIVLALVQDANGFSPSATLLLGGALAALVLALLAIDGVVHAIPVRPWFPRVLRPLAITTMAVPGLLYGIWAAVGDSELPSWTSVALILTAVAAGTLIGWVRWPGDYAAATWTRGLVVATAFMASLHLAVHWVTGTLRAVRPGTELLHVGLFIGTWLASTAVALALATRYAGVPSGGRRWLSRTMAVATLVAGFVVLQADRVMLVDLYAAVHLWLGVIGLLGLDLGLRMFLSRRRSRAWSWVGVVAFAVLLAASGMLIVRWKSLGDVALRSELKNTSLGATALLLLPRPAKASQLPADLRHPALEFDQYLDAWPPNERFNVLLISIDAMRADALGPVDAPTPYMPVVASLAKDSVRFRRAYSPGSRTAMAMSSLTLGRYSANIDWNLWLYRGGKIFNRKTLAPERVEAFGGKFVFTTIPTFPEGTTLAERMKGAGYTTVAVPYAMQNQFFRKGTGFDRGFDHFEDLTQSRFKTPSSDKVAEIAVHQLQQLDKQPWFVWVHLYDPHEAKHKLDEYHRLLGITDHAVGTILEQVKSRGEYARTVVVVLADHGQAFGEHRHSGHASSLYDEQTRVPLLIRVPGVPGRDEDRPVTTIDATATLAALARADTRLLDGVNLMPLMTKNEYPPVRPVFTELHRFMSNKGERTKDLKAVIWDDYKLIIDRKRDTAELYNLAVDPKESKNLVREEPATFERLSAVLNRFVEAGERAHPLP